VMTVGLSVSKKSVVETKITTDEELLKQAFNAAESGLDYYLGTGETKYTAGDRNSFADVTVQNIGGGTTAVNMGGLTLRNEESFTWLVGHNADGSINFGEAFLGTGLSLCVDSDFDGSLKVDYFYRSGASYLVQRSGFNVVTAGRTNGYSNVGSTALACRGVPGMRSITLSGLTLSGVTPLLLAVKPMADDTRIAVTGSGGVFPVQGKEITSVGKAGGDVTSVESKVSRKIKVVDTYRMPPFMMDAVTATGSVLGN